MLAATAVAVAHGWGSRTSYSTRPHRQVPRGFRHHDPFRWRLSIRGDPISALRDTAARCRRTPSCCAVRWTPTTAVTSTRCWPSSTPRSSGRPRSPGWSAATPWSTAGPRRHRQMLARLLRRGRTQIEIHFSYDDVRDLGDRVVAIGTIRTREGERRGDRVAVRTSPSCATEGDPSARLPGRRRGARGKPDSRSRAQPKAVSRRLPWFAATAIGNMTPTVGTEGTGLHRAWG